MIEVNDVVEQADDENLYVVTEIIGDKLFCLQVAEEAETMQEMAVLDVRTAVKVIAPPPEEEEFVLEAEDDEQPEEEEEEA